MWILGWCLLMFASIAVALWLIAAIRDARARLRVSLVGVAVLAVSVALIAIAVTIAPLWGSGAGTA